MRLNSPGAFISKRRMISDSLGSPVSVVSEEVKFGSDFAIIVQNGMWDKSVQRKVAFRKVRDTCTT
jgi:hypothetical protein